MQNGMNEMVYSIEAKMKALLLKDSLDDATFNLVFSGSHTLIATKFVTTSGVEPAGAKSIAFHLSSNFQGSINNVPHTHIKGDMIYNAHQGMTLPAISYTITTGNLYIERFE